MGSVILFVCLIIEEIISVLPSLHLAGVSIGQWLLLHFSLYIIFFSVFNIMYMDLKMFSSVYLHQI